MSRVDEADAVAEFGERDGEVDGDGGLAYAALAGADGDDVADAAEGERSGGHGCMGVGHLIALSVGSG